MPHDLPARNTDPATSRDAAAELVASGRQALQQQEVLAAVRARPGLTSAELAQASDLDRYAVARRLPELERRGLVRRDGPRPCAVMSRMALTWWPT